MLSSRGKVFYFHIMFLWTNFYFFISIFCCFAALKIFCHYLKSVFTVQYYMVTSPFQMSNKVEYIWNIYGFGIYMVYLFYFEAALFTCFKNVLNFPNSDFFCKKIRHFVVINFFIFSFLLLVLIVLPVIVLFMPGF